MEGIPKTVKEEVVGSDFNRETIVSEAAKQAELILNERIDSGLSASEREDSIIELMEELAVSNENRFLVEAIAQRLTLERASMNYHSLSAQYPLAA
ncbi:MAG: hypothetical protein RLZZ230_914 [Candidatus Parcubacteria bacterium]|jgi:hypothetical protein